MKATVPPTETEEVQKPYDKRRAAVNLVAFSILFVAWLVIQLHK